MAVDASYYRELVLPLTRGRKFVVLGGAVAGSGSRMVAALRDLQAEKPFLLGQHRGTGALPTEDEAAWHSLEIEAGSIVEGLHEFERALGDLPEGARAALERYDPERRALVMGLIVLQAVPELAGRRRYGCRPEAWRALEDKTVIDDLWSQLGIAHAPYAVVPATNTSLTAAAVSLNRGAGVVLAGDCHTMIHGGAEFVRWVRDQEQVDRAAEFFAPRCKRVRVMPFLEGIPCSMHGLVFPNGSTVVLRPVEMVTLRRPGEARFHYGGMGTYWDPSDEARAAMRALTRRVAEGLRQAVDYRGPFTLDGVLTSRGFLPTELNPRWGAGLNVLAAALPEVPLGLLSMAAIEGEPWDFRADDLERLLLTAADEHRGGFGSAMVAKRWTETQELSAVREGREFRLAREGETADATLAAGPSGSGGFVRFTPRPESCVRGEPLGPTVVAGLALADRVLDTSIGTLLAARAAR